MATLSDLRSSLRLRVQDDASVRWTNAQLDEVINQSARELANALRTFVKDTTIAIVAGTREVLVDDLLEIISITRDDGYPLFGPISYNDLKWNRQHTGSQPIMWYNLGNTVGLYPEPSANFNLALAYIAYPPTISGDTSTPDSSLGPYADMFILARSAAELYYADPDLETGDKFMDQAMKYLIEAQSNRNQINNTRGPVVGSANSGGDLWPLYL